MKKIQRILILCVCFVQWGCSKEIKLSEGIDRFNVKVYKLEFKENEEITFNFEGNPDMISFYSGELYSDYLFRNNRVIDLIRTNFSFRHAFPVKENSQISEFDVLVSTDFNGIYDYENISNANWVSLKSNFVYATNATYINAGTYEISQLYEPTKPIYYAFRYKSQPQEVNGLVRSVALQSIQLEGFSVYGSHILSNVATSDFTIIEKSDDAKTATTLTSTTITFNGYSRTLNTDPDPETDTWVVSKAFELKQIENGPDRPVALKGNQDAELKSFNYTYLKEGVYKAYFIGVNANIDNYKEVLREVEIKVVKEEL